MATILQHVGPADFDQELTSTGISFPNPLTKGSTVVVCVSHIDYGGTNPGFSVSGVSIDAESVAVDPSGFCSAAILIAQNSTGGATPIIYTTASSGTNANSYGYVYAYEIGGVGSAGLDSNGTVGNDSASSNAPSVVCSNPLGVAGSISFCVFSGSDSFAGATTPPTGNGGWVDSYVDLTSVAETPSVFAYQLNPSAVTISAAIGTLTGATKWAGVVLTIDNLKSALALMGVGT